MSKSIFKEDKKYTFSDYFYFTNPTEELANHFGYSLTTKIIDFSTSTVIDKIQYFLYNSAFMKCYQI